MQIASVTRFGQISPFWKHVQSIWHLFEGLFSIVQNVGMTLAKFLLFGKIDIVVNDQKLNKYSSHLVTLQIPYNKSKTTE